MNTKFRVISICLPFPALAYCEDEQTTTVNKSLLRDNTIVSRGSSKGSYTRTEYGSDFFGNKTIEVSRGHENAAEQGDVAAFLLNAAAALFAASADR